MEITSIDPLLRLIEGKPEFVHLQKDGYQVIDYVYQDQNTFDIPELMECRGIKFCSQGLILARPFRKFFNYGERGSDLPVWRPHYITEKLDGSMVHPVLLDNKDFFLMTRKGHTDVAQKAERYIMGTDVRYIPFCKAMLRGQWTPIFEYTGPNNRIVLRYEQEGLHLLALRHTINGSLMARATLVAIAEPYGVPPVPIPSILSIGIKNVEEFVKHTRELTDAEGYVIYFDDGYMVKIKAEDYVLKHRALDDLGSKRKVVALCCQGFVDDVLPILSEPDAKELLEFNDALMQEVNEIMWQAKNLGQMVKTGAMSRKHWAITYAPGIEPPWLAGVAFGVMDGKSARMLVLKAVEKHYEDVGVLWRGE